MITEKYKKEKEKLLKIITQTGFQLEYAESCFKNDKDVVLAAVKRNAGQLKYASENLRDDKDVVLAAIQNFDPNPVHFMFKEDPLQHASQRLQEEISQQRINQIEDLHNEGEQE